MPKIDYRSYWDQNIDKWGELYLEMSHPDEKLNAPNWLSNLYQISVGRLERRLMSERYDRTVKFLDSYLQPGVKLSDIGCGTGVFVVQAVKRAAHVNAIDFSAHALDITTRRVNEYSPSASVDYYQLDVQTQQVPQSDVAIAMGVAPYISDLAAFLANILPFTKVFCCLYVDPSHWANRLRTALPLLNVRKLQFHSREEVDAIYSQHGWHILDRTNFATGYIDVAAAGRQQS